MIRLSRIPLKMNTSPTKEISSIVKRKGRKIWSTEEDNALLAVIAKCGNRHWTIIADELHKISGSTKTEKQCREHYRNYLNPAITTTEWKSQEKVLFLILHRYFGNQWSLISKYLNQRSDIAIKNFFYSSVRKALRIFKTGTVPQSVLKKPLRLFMIYTEINLVRNNYILSMEESQGITKRNPKEKIIIHLVKELNTTKEALEEYETLLISTFKSYNANITFPVKIEINLDELKISGLNAKELISIQGKFNLPPLNQILCVQISENAVSLPVTAKTIPLINNNFSRNMPVFQRPILPLMPLIPQYPIINPGISYQGPYFPWFNYPFIRHVPEWQDNKKPEGKEILNFKK